uniref:Wall-associated kinase n=1 Tax=Zea mays TaxID=4577 RepID=A0A0A7END8_MAIZE|nr:wall-associated kinase [Zea mays]
MSSLLLRVLLIQLAAVECLSAAIPGCLTQCGGVEIPYPFGVGTNCSRKGFRIKCINGSAGEEIPVLLPTTRYQNIRVLNLSVSPLPEARVLLPVAWQCFNAIGGVTGIYSGDVDFNPEGVYRISNTQNELFVLGCDTYAFTKGVRVHNVNARFPYRYFTGCITVSVDEKDPRDGACAGLGCCRVDIPPGITDTSMTFSSTWTRANQTFCPCDYAFIVEKGNYTFKASDLVSHTPDNRLPLDWWTMPLRLDWAIRDNNGDSMTSISCAQAPNEPDYGCRSKHSECTNSTNGPGYFCKCAHGYDGNPYVQSDGECTNINECQDPKSHNCSSGSKCIDTDGGYYCQCNFFRRGQQCDPLIPMAAVALLTTFAAVVLGCVAIVLLQTLNNRKRFNRNGGKLLNAQGITTYTKRELKKITNGYSKRLGGGHFGNVYEGTIVDGRKVAVKCPLRTRVSSHRCHWKNLIRPRRVPLPQQRVEEDGSFMNEIRFQFEVSRHKNLVQLLGCCLETDIPILVFEFVANGSLEDILHSAKKPCTLSLPERLDIAIGSAEAIAYMHSLDNQKRVHGDIKPSNILLDDDLNPKVSDFGSSKLLAIHSYYVRAVAADIGYMDPLYMKTEHFTLECDVYSFGVVLLELITRRRGSWYEQDQQGNKILPIEFVKCFKDHGSGCAMYDSRLDFSGEDTQSRCNKRCLDMIGMLAVRCLKEDKRERPTMAEVVEELKRVKVLLLGTHI